MALESRELEKDQITAPAVPGAAAFALWVLVALAALSPWPFGCVHPIATRLITLAALGAAIVAVAAQAVRGRLAVPAVPVWPVAGLLAVAALQLLPLPPSLHAFLAPGSSEIWRPAEAAAAAVIGDAWHPVSIQPEATVRWLGLTTGLIALALVAAPALTDSQAAVRTAARVAVGGAALSAYGIVARALFGPLLYGRIPVATVSPFGPFVGKNHFAGYVEMAALLTLGLALGLRDRERASTAGPDWVQGPQAARVLLAYGASLVMLLGVLVSLSRGGIVSLAAGGLITLGLRAILRRRRASAGRLARALPALLIVGLLVSLLPGEAHHRILSLAGVTTEPSGSFRLDTWRDGLRMAKASLVLGQGLGAFADGFPRYKQGHGNLRVEHAENDYLELLAEAGVTGLGLALLAAVTFGRTALRALRRCENRLSRGVALGALGGVVALLVHSAFDFNLRIPSNAILFALVVSALASVATVRSVGPRPAWAATAALLALLIAALRAPVAPSVDGHGDIRIAALTRDATGRSLRLARAEAALRESLRSQPASAEAWLLLGWVRAAQGSQAEGAALARWGSSLDPERAALRAEAQRLEDSLPGFRATRRP